MNVFRSEIYLHFLFAHYGMVQELGELFACFGKDGRLEVNYCLTQAYG